MAPEDVLCISKELRLSISRVLEYNYETSTDLHNHRE